MTKNLSRTTTTLAARGLISSALFCAALSASCAGTPITKDHISSPGQALFNGQVRDEINCYSCHNGDGSGTWRGPDLGKRVPGLTDAQIATAIAEGPSLMPAFKDKLSEAETKEIVAWLRQRFPSKP